jgi:dedicator of cytokinesis protein 3
LYADELGQAEAYEIAIDICQELAKQHETQTFNYSRLSDLLMHQARLYERINDTTRAFPEYFRIVSFQRDLINTDLRRTLVASQMLCEASSSLHAVSHGRNLPLCRSLLCIRLTTSCDTIQVKHPTARLHRSMVAPSEALQNGEELVIWVTGLNPEPDLSKPALRVPTVSENVQSYWRHCDIDTFSCQRSYRSTAHDGTGENDILDLWIEKTILTGE